MNPTLGLGSAGLTPCEKESNCFHSSRVKSQSLNNKSKDELNKIRQAMETMGLEAVEINDSYLYFTSKSAIFGFVDDVEFHLTDEGNLQFRSASRVGHSDLGVNEKRINEILKTALNVQL
jgi:uncharacterized protein (DUF1499 family)